MNPSAVTPPMPAANKSAVRQRPWIIIGDVALVLLIVIAAFWTYWGVAEMYYEGWWGPFLNRLGYLIPGAACLLLSLLIIRWPRAGGWLLILLGGSFTAFYWSLQFSRWGFNWGSFLAIFPVSGLLVLLGVIFVMSGRARRQEAQLNAPTGTIGRGTFFRHNWRYLLAVGLPLLVLIVLSAFNLPIILRREDDGDRGARLVASNGVTLVWAPAGPGWGRGLLATGPEDFKQPGGVLSWNEIALNGHPATVVDDASRECDFSSPAGCASQEDMSLTGLCRYLSADGTELRAEPQDIWRMPTVDEMVRSLARHGENAGCSWDGVADQADCRITPDKEPPLWDPQSSAIYYWAADEFDQLEAYYINYNGNAVQHQPKSYGNARHGYRCVREP